MQGKTVFISGATSGIGKATAITLGGLGCRFILTGRRREKLEETKKALASSGNSSVLTLEFDVQDYYACEEAVSSLPSAWSAIDILINNAGLARGFSGVQDGDIEDWESMIDTNIKGLLYLTRLIVPGMIERGDGHIVNVGSIAGKEVYPKGNVYCATKFAVDALSRAMRLDLYRHNIRVSQIAPGHVEETEFSLVRFDGDREKAKIYEDFNPLTSADVANAIRFILTQPPHVNIQDIVLMGRQQANANFIHRSGRNFDQ